VDELGDIVSEFLVESHENLDQLDRDLVALEQTPGSRELLSSIFRTIHTIKGTSGFLAFHRLERVTHVGESLLSRLRDGAQAMTPQVADALLRMVDVVRVLLGSIEELGGEGEVDVEGVVVAVTACIADGSAPPAAAGPPAAATKPTAKKAAAKAPPVEAPPADEPPHASEAEAEPEPEPEAGGELATVPATVPVAAAPNPAAAPAGDGDAGGTRRSVADSSIRVDVDLLDTLMRLVGELVLTRNQLVRAIGSVADQSMLRTGQRLNLITSELQESVMKTRMQAIDHLWAKLPRVVRDLSSACGKQVRLAMVGRETELDRSLLEAVKDPLTHLVRNAVDHGVEEPEERLRLGKPPEGVLTLRAYHEGGHVIVEVADDGAGMDPDKIARVAVERGVVSRDALATMDRREILALVFRAGFSTAAAVTNVSGRGVGMDVVKTNIERIGGAVEVDSTVGVGTVWRLTIPLTLAIIQALTIECAGQRYVIPQVAVHELVFLDGQSGRVIEHAMGAPVYRLRGNLLPLVHLGDTLGVEAEQSGDKDVYVAVLQAEGRRFGLVVDRVLNTEEVVVKPLSARFKDIGVYAGATLLGDGQVALILDVASLARRSHLAAGSAGDREQAAPTQRSGSGGVDRLLIAGVGDRRVAIPLDMVTRLEEFPASKIEHAGAREVVQYRDQILPVLRLAHLLGTYSSETEQESVPVVVYTEHNRSVALAVERIIDIVEDTLNESRRDFGDDGLLGSAVIQQRVTELLDVRRAILAADPMFTQQDGAFDPYDPYAHLDQPHADHPDHPSHPHETSNVGGVR
jgi:two-component system chemotaxis sensor kinase CheA